MSHFDNLAASLGRTGETVFIHRDGIADTPALARPFGQPSVRMVGEIQQKVRRLVVLVDDVLSPLLPLTSNDFLVMRGKTLAIEDVDDDTRRINGILIGLELTVVD
jgi:hypothetical protein